MPALNYSQREPGVTFEKLPNPKQLLIPGGVAEVAFVGKSKTTNTVSEEEVTRAANGSAGKSVSAISAGTTAVGTETLTINLNNDGVQTITLAANVTGATIAADIQTKVRALTAAIAQNQAAYDTFTATFASGAPDQYTLTSGTLGHSSAVVISTGTGAVLLKLGLANGGVETIGVNGQDVLSATTASSIDAIFDENGVTYFVTSDFILTAPNKVDWVPGGNVPAAGVKYYVTYEVAKTATDYDVKVCYSLDEVEDLYGSHLDPANEIAVAAYLYFLNGAAKLTTVQVDGPTMNDFFVAFDKLALEDYDVVIPLQSNSIGFESLFSLIKGRIFQLSQPLENRQRIALVSPVVGTTIQQYKSLANALNFQRMAVTAPSSITVTLNTQVTLPGYFLNAAMAGFLADPDNYVSEPLTRKELFGVDDIGVRYTRSQTRDLIGQGILIVENYYGLIRVVHGITTDMTSVDRNEISLVRVGDYFGKTLRVVLDKMYTGTRLDPAQLSSIRTTITAVIDNFIAKSVLVASADLSVTQNTLNPTAVDVFVRIQPVYPLNFIDIQFTEELL